MSTLAYKVENSLSRIPSFKKKQSIWVSGSGWKIKNYIKILSGRFKAWKSLANFLTDSIEDKSSGKTSTRAPLVCLRISSLTAFPASTFLAQMITCAPRSASTLTVSAPIPLAPPAPNHNQSKLLTLHGLSL